MKTPVLFLFSSIGLFSCQNNERLTQLESYNIKLKDTTVIVANIILPLPFGSIEHNYDYEGILLPEGFSYEVLFSQGDPVLTKNGESYPAKNNHDMIGIHYLNDNYNAVKMFISHETREIDDHLGDGGGATLFEIIRNDSLQWRVTSPYHHVDFSKVGGTSRNCGGSISPNNTFFSCEETYPTRMSHIYRDGKGMRDTSDFLGRPRYENFGFAVEIDANSGEVIKKHYQMGRFMHEDMQFMDDNKTIYMTDDYNPAVFFKFVSHQPLDYNSGKLFAYQQDEKGKGGQWLELPNDSSTWYNTRDVAIKMGATLFIRHEWMTLVDGKIYISETGDDDFDWTKHINKGGRPAHHINENLKIEGTKYDDVFGRILVFDPTNNHMEVLLEGGMIDSIHAFSNPDAITNFEYGGKKYLLIQEDINWYSRGRVNKEAEKRRMFYNEIYLLDLSIEGPQLKDLIRFAALPKGSEPSGGIFSNDGKTLFINIMHPWHSNSKPFNKACTIAIYGW